MKKRRAKEVKIILESSISTSVKYKQLESDDKRFSELMRLYSSLCTFEGLIKEYDDLEIKKQLEILGISYDNWELGHISDKNESFVMNNITPIWAEDVEEYISSVLEKEEYHNIIIHSMSAFTANKIKNKCEELMGDIFDYYLVKETLKKENSTEYVLNSGEVLDEKTRRKIYSKLSRHISPSVDDDPKDRERLLKSLIKLGISKETIENLELKCGSDIRTITDTKMHMLSIKDQEIQETVDLLKEDGTLSYGLLYTPVKGDKYGNETEPLLVIDLPYYGQFSLHLKAEKSSETALSKETMAELEKMPYRFPLYERKTVLLSDISSEEASRIESLDSKDLHKKATSWSETERNFAHYAALKLGATRTDLYKIYDLKVPEVKKGEIAEEGGRD